MVPKDGPRVRGRSLQALKTICLSFFLGAWGRTPGRHRPPLSLGGSVGRGISISLSLSLSRTHGPPLSLSLSPLSLSLSLSLSCTHSPPRREGRPERRATSKGPSERKAHGIRGPPNVSQECGAPHVTRCVSLSLSLSLSPSPSLATRISMPAEESSEGPALWSVRAFNFAAHVIFATTAFALATFALAVLAFSCHGWSTHVGHASWRRPFPPLPFPFLVPLPPRPGTDKCRWTMMT